MSKNANYNSLTLAVYVTQEDLDRVVEYGFQDVDLVVGKDKFPAGVVHINLDSVAQAALNDFVRAEREAIELGKLAWKKGKLIEIEPGHEKPLHTAVITGDEDPGVAKEVDECPEENQPLKSN
jgi:hypothetical protein